MGDDACHMSSTGSGGGAAGPGALSRVLLKLGLLLAAFSFTSWWVSHTILDVSRTEKVTHVVLSDGDFRSFVAREISPSVSAAVPTASIDQALAAVESGAVGPVSTTPTSASTSAPTATTTPSTSEGADQLNSRLAAVLGRPAVERQLENFIVDLHKALLGKSDQPAVLSQATVTQIVTAAMPSLPSTALTGLHDITVNPPKIGALSTARTLLQDKFGLLVAVAAVVLFAGIILSKNRRASTNTIGRWLIGISLVHLLVLWVIPVVIVPAVTKSPWASLIAAVARALSAGLLVVLVMLFVAGVAILAGNRFTPRSPPAG
jgi:hypothetical protein